VAQAPPPVPTEPAVSLAPPLSLPLPPSMAAAAVAAPAPGGVPATLDAFPGGAVSALGVWTLGLGLLGDSESAERCGGPWVAFGGTVTVHIREYVDERLIQNERQ